MMKLSKKRIQLITALLLICALLLGGCGKSSAPDEVTAQPEPVTDSSPAPTPIPDDGTGLPDESYPADGKYTVAMVTGGGELRDGGVNEGVWRGVKTCAFANGAAYKYYIPEGHSPDEDAIVDAMSRAAEGGAQVVICCGPIPVSALSRSASAWPDIKWACIDGTAGLDVEGQPLPNSAGIGFDPLFGGYLAGWAAVAEGCTRLGFCGAGGGEDARCCRWGYGFVQGANAAAAERDVELEIHYTWLYGASYAPSDKLEALLESWYGAGTELVLACGGELYLSAAAAAENGGGRVIAAETDGNAQPEAVLCSVVKSFDTAAYRAVSAFFEGRWEDLGGGAVTLGLADGAVSLSAPSGVWPFESFTEADYTALLESWTESGPEIDGEYPEAQGRTMAQPSFSNARVNVAD